MPEQQEVLPDKEKGIGVHQLKIEKYLSGDGEELICKVTLNDSLKFLLGEFVVKTLPATVEDIDGIKIKRYKIKSVLRSSSNWNNAFSYFFTKDAIDEGHFEAHFKSVGFYQNFLDYLRYFRDLIKNMEELKRGEAITISYRVER